MEVGVTTEMSYPARASQIVGTLLLRRVPFWQRSRSRRVVRLVVLVCYVYIATLLVLLALEDRLLFPAATIARPWREPPDYLQVREQTFVSATGDRIDAWFSAPDGWAPHRGAVL